MFIVAHCAWGFWGDLDIFRSGVGAKGGREGCFWGGFFVFFDFFEKK
jgi:hypothetical protein